VTRSLTPSKVSAPPFLPAVVQLGPEIVPALPLPDESASSEPEPPLNEYAATRPPGCSGAGQAVVVPFALACVDDCVHSQGVGGAAAEAAEGVGPRRRVVRADRVTAAVEVVARDTDVVGGGVPAQRQRGLGLTADGEPSRSRRRLRIGCRGSSDGSAHVGLQLGGRQSPAVDANVVELPAEPLGPDRVAAEAKRAGRSGDAAGVRAGAGERAVHVEADGRAVVRRREMGPGVQGQRRRTDCVLLAVDVHLADGLQVLLARVQRVHDAAAALLGQNRSPAADRGRANPRLERHAGAEVERSRVGHGDPVINAVECQGTLVLARCRPRGSCDSSVVSVARRVCDERPGACIEGVRGDKCVRLVDCFGCPGAAHGDREPDEHRS
jgi:hypothetical protein